MRSLTAALIAILLVATNSTSFLPNEKPLGSNMDNLKDFMGALFAPFNVSSTNVENCFNEVTALSYFGYLQLLYQMAGAYYRADRSVLSQYNEEYQALNLTLYLTWDCIHKADDFKSLLSAIGLADISTDQFKIVEDAYFFAHTQDWFDGFTPVNAAIQNKDYKTAGTAYAPVVAAMGANSTTTNVTWMTGTTFLNGVFFQSNIDFVQDSQYCFNNATAALALSYIEKWAAAAVQGPETQSLANTDAFFKGEGAQILQQIPQDQQTCFFGSNDFKRLNNYLGVDVSSQ